MRSILILLLVWPPLFVRAAELRLEFSDAAVGQSPKGFSSLVAGGGSPGRWEIVMDDVPPLLAPLSPQARTATRHPALAQLAQDTADEHFPMLIYDGATFGDFTLTTRLKMTGGRVEQMAGIAFRVQDEKNFYVVRASALGGNIKFYKVVNGIRSDPIGRNLEVPAGVWHELKIQCKGSEIYVEFNGREAIPRLVDGTFKTGRIGFWTKSDSVSHFTGTVIHHTPRTPLVQTLVRDLAKNQKRLLGLKVYAPDKDGRETHVIASNNDADLGSAGGRYELEVIRNGGIFHSKSADHVALVMPLRDRNGEVIAAVRIHLIPSVTQSQQGALARATPIVKALQAQLQTAGSLLE